MWIRTFTTPMPPISFVLVYLFAFAGNSNILSALGRAPVPRNNRKENWNLHNLLKWHVIKCVYFEHFGSLFTLFMRYSLVVRGLFCVIATHSLTSGYSHPNPIPSHKNLFTFYTFSQVVFMIRLYTLMSIVPPEFGIELTGKVRAESIAEKEGIWLTKLKDILFCHWHQSLKLQEANFIR